MAASGLFRGRPLQSQLLSYFWEETEKFAFHPGLGFTWLRLLQGGVVINWARDSSSESEAANHMLSSSRSLSFTPNKTRSLVLVDRRWSDWMQRTEKAALCGESEAHGTWTSVNSLLPENWDPLSQFVFLTSILEEETGRAWGVESISEKRSICKCKVASIMFLQWEQFFSVRVASVWEIPKQEAHSPWPSTACRGDLHKLH